MPGNDIDAIAGLEGNHRRVLAGKLGITSLQALADADERAIYAALVNIRPRPTLARIAQWRGDARAHLAAEANDRSAWQTAASFAVIFSRRQVDGGWERRVEAEQTEVEPAREPRHWPGWDCGPLCDWMLAQAGVADDVAGLREDIGGKPQRAGLSIDSATVTDAVRDLDLITAGQVVPGPPGDLRYPVRLRFTVHGARSGQQLRAAVWFRRPDGPGWSPQEPVIVPPSGRAEFDLSSVPPGGHQIRLLAWATDPGATLAAAPLPTLTFR